VKPAYRRLLVKLSGEQLAGKNGFGISPTVIKRIAQELREVHELGVDLCVVIGGGNVIRGITASAQGRSNLTIDSKRLADGVDIVIIEIDEPSMRIEYSAVPFAGCLSWSRSTSSWRPRCGTTRAPPSSARMTWTRTASGRTRSSNNSG